MTTPPQDPKIIAATEKAWRGSHLFAVGDYEGAIMAFTEALDLNPSMTGARRTLEAVRERFGLVHYDFYVDGWDIGGRAVGKQPLAVGDRFRVTGSYFDHDVVVMELTHLDGRIRADLEFVPSNDAPGKGDRVKIVRYGDRAMARFVGYEASYEFQGRCLCFLGWVGVALNQPNYELWLIDPHSDVGPYDSVDFYTGEHFYLVKDVVEVQFEHPCTKHGRETACFLVDELSKDLDKELGRSDNFAIGRYCWSCRKPIGREVEHLVIDDVSRSLHPACKDRIVGWAR